MSKKRTKKFLKSSAKLYLGDDKGRHDNLDQVYDSLITELPEGDIKEILQKNYAKYKETFVSYLRNGNKDKGSRITETVNGAEDSEVTPRKTVGETNQGSSKNGEGKDSKVNESPMDRFLHSLTVAVGREDTSTWRHFIDLMFTYMKEMQSLSRKLWTNGKTENEKIQKTAEEIWEVVTVCHFHQQCIKSESGVVPSYQDVMAALMSLFLDLTIVYSRSGSVKKKQQGRLLCMRTCYVVDKSHCLDVILVSEQMEGQDSKLVLPFIRHCLAEVNPRTSHGDYLKYMLTVHKVRSVLVEKAEEIYQTALAVPAPKKFMTWLSSHAPTAVESMPDDKKFKGRHVTCYLLDELTEELFENLMDVLVALAEVTEEAPESSGKKRRLSEDYTEEYVHVSDEEHAEKKRQRLDHEDEAHLRKEGRKKKIKKKGKFSEEQEDGGAFEKKKSKKWKAIQEETDTNGGNKDTQKLFLIEKKSKKNIKKKKGDKVKTSSLSAAKMSEGDNERNEDIFFIDKGDKNGDEVETIGWGKASEAPENGERGGSEQQAVEVFYIDVGQTFNTAPDVKDDMCEDSRSSRHSSVCIVSDSEDENNSEEEKNKENLSITDANKHQHVDVTMVEESEAESDIVTVVPDITLHKKTQMQKVMLEDPLEMSPVVESAITRASSKKSRSGSDVDERGDKDKNLSISEHLHVTPKRNIRVKEVKRKGLDWEEDLRSLKVMEEQKGTCKQSEQDEGQGVKVIEGKNKNSGDNENVSKDESLESVISGDEKTDKQLMQPVFTRMRTRLQSSFSENDCQGQGQSKVSESSDRSAVETSETNEKKSSESVVNGTLGVKEGEKLHDKSSDGVESHNSVTPRKGQQVQAPRRSRRLSELELLKEEAFDDTSSVDYSFNVAGHNLRMGGYNLKVSRVRTSSRCSDVSNSSVQSRQHRMGSVLEESDSGLNKSTTTEGSTEKREKSTRTSTRIRQRLRSSRGVSKEFSLTDIEIVSTVSSESDQNTEGESGDGPKGKSSPLTLSVKEKQVHHKDEDNVMQRKSQRISSRTTGRSARGTKSQC